MTTPIKPPGSPPIPPDSIDVADVGGTDKPSRTFGEVMFDRSHGVTEEIKTREILSDPVGRIYEELKTGEITTDTAIEKLVENAMQNSAVQLMSPAQREELETLLRSSLKEDPTLVAMTQHLKRQEPADE